MIKRDLFFTTSIQRQFVKDDIYLKNEERKQKKNYKNAIEMFSTKNVPDKVITGKKVLIYLCWKSAYHTKVKTMILICTT